MSRKEVKVKTASAASKLDMSALQRATVEQQDQQHMISFATVGKRIWKAPRWDCHSIEQITEHLIVGLSGLHCGPHLVPPHDPKHRK